MAESTTKTEPQAEALETDVLSTLLKNDIDLEAFKQKSDKGKKAVGSAVMTLVEQALEHTALISDDALRSIESIIAELDRKMTEQINLILHHEDYQKLESSWRGLDYLVSNTATDETLKIRVMNVSKKELHKTLKKYKGTSWDQSPIFKQIYTEEYGTLGGAPYGSLIGDYYFDNSPPDVQLLNQIAEVAAASHAPFITAPAPSLFNMDSWQELSNPSSISKIFSTTNPEYAGWNSLRESEDSRYIGMAMPRFLARLPYGANTNPVDEFAFEEDVDGTNHNKYSWANAAYAMATNINSAFKNYGWCSRIRGVESGGAVEGLHTHTFSTDDGGVDMKCPTEIAIDDRREKELADNGFMPLCHKKNTDFAAFIGAQSLQKPTKYDTHEATSNAKLAANLPYLFATCRFAHYLKVMVRDKVGGFKEREDMEVWLNRWIKQYVNEDTTANEIARARKPLAAAEVVVEEVEGSPGYYSSKFFLRPHYQLEGLSISLRLVSRLPSAGG